MYKFQIDDLDKLDLDRIIRENEKVGIHATVIDSKPSQVLLLSNTFLARFACSDDVCVNGKRLFNRWGFELATLTQDGHEIASSPYGQIPVTKGRAMATTVSDALVQELQLAFAYERQISVTVLQFKQDANFC